MNSYRLRNIAQYLSYCDKSRDENIARRHIEASLTPFLRRIFWVKGWSYPAGSHVYFKVSHRRAEGNAINWREKLICPVTKLNNRMRAAVQILDSECETYPGDAIYITENVTSLYRYLAGKYRNIQGSEYLGEGIDRGASDSRGIRNEDLTGLTFGAASFDKVLSFDCLEHIPEYKSAIGECHRVLNASGILLLSVPFDCRSANNMQRATVLPDGTVEHLTTPEYHGDPLGGDGCLSYWTFGWELLEDLRCAGFSDVYAMLYWSAAFGYLGVDQVMFIAKK